MNAGTLDRVITIQSFSATANEFGEPEKTWATLYAGIPARVEPLQGREYFQSQQLQAASDTRFTIRYVSGITNKMRVVYRSENYDIQSVINTDERNRELQLMCRAVE